MNKTLYISGANAPYFTVILPLLYTFDAFVPNSRLMVCDFGLSEAQCRFLGSRGQLLPAPKDLPHGLHPFYYKASMGRYVEHATFDQLVWIDADTFLAAPLDSAVNAICQEQKDRPFLAVCEDSAGSIRHFTSRYDAQPFEQMLAEAGISQDLPYLNSALFIVRSREMLRRWGEMVFKIPQHVLHEQNIFNILARTLFDEPLMLDKERWNVHDDDLNGLQLAEADSATKGQGAPFGINLKGKDVLIVHATSADQRSATFSEISLPVGDQQLEGLFRAARNPSMAQLTHFLMQDFIRIYREDLMRSGVLVGGAKQGGVS